MKESHRDFLQYSSGAVNLKPVQKSFPSMRQRADMGSNTKVFVFEGI